VNTPQHGALEAEAREDLGKLPDVTELIGHVADRHAAAESRSPLEA
jgi:hypothetical protein